MGKKIIVVDDSRTARQQVVQALVDDGYEVIEAIDGSDGLNKIKANPDTALVIVDVNMPRMNGLEMLSAAKASGPGGVAFLMLTTEAQPELVQQAKALGAKGWIVKPFKPDLLRSAVTKLAGPAK
jgi:two-component system, chemotaxis family, chemotaxis protein CheY